MDASTSHGEPSNKKTRSNQAAAQNAEPLPDIFKLDVDCFQEIFDYLSILDMVSMGRTCKRMQKVAGDWFLRTYSDHKLRLKCGNYSMVNAEGVRLKGVREYTSNITISSEYLFC